MLQGPIEHDHEDPLLRKVVRVSESQKSDAVQPNRRLTAACPALQEDSSRIRGWVIARNCSPPADEGT